MKKYLKPLLILLLIPICICVIIIIVSLSITLYLELTESPPGITPYDKVILFNEDIVIGEQHMNIQDVYNIAEEYGDKWDNIIELLCVDVNYDCIDSTMEGCTFYFRSSPIRNMYGVLEIKCFYNGKNQWILNHAEITYDKIDIDNNIDIKKTSEVLDLCYLWLQENIEEDESWANLRITNELAIIDIAVIGQYGYDTTRILFSEIEWDENGDVLPIQPKERDN